MPKISEYNQFFDRFDGFAVCKLCGKKLQTKGGNTSGLKKHYEGQHSQTDRLNHFLSQQNESTSPIKPRGAHTLTKDFEMLDQTGEKTQRLHLLENALLTIRPTSVQSERIFSNVGKVATKVRARLSDKSLNAIIALRAFYQSESKTNTQ